MRGKIGNETPVHEKNLVLNYLMRRGMREEEEEEESTFPNTAICIGCGKEKHVNPFGFCCGCWIRFSHLRKKLEQKEEQTPCYDLI